MSLSFDFRINHQVSQRRLKLSGRLNILKKKIITKPFKREIWNAELDLNIPHPLYSAELNACCSIGSVQLSWTERVYSTQLNWVELNAWVWVHPYIRPKTGEIMEQNFPISHNHLITNSVFIEGRVHHRGGVAFRMCQSKKKISPKNTTKIGYLWK